MRLLRSFDPSIPLRAGFAQDRLPRNDVLLDALELGEDNLKGKLRGKFIVLDGPNGKVR